MSNTILLKKNGVFFSVPYSEISYLQADNKYLKVFTLTGSYLIRSSISSFERSLPPIQFCRIHRCYIVSLNQVSNFNYKEIFFGKAKLPIGKSYRKSFKQKITDHLKSVQSKRAFAFFCRKRSASSDRRFYA